MDSSNPEMQDILNPANQEVIAKAPGATKEETFEDTDLETAVDYALFGTNSP